MTDKKMNRADFYTSIILLIFSVGIIVISLRMPSMADRNESPWSGPGVVPTFIGAALLLLAGSMLVRSIMRGVLKPDPDESAQIEAAQPDIQDKVAGLASAGKRPKLSVSTFRILITLALCVLYAIALGKIWFPLATFLFIFIFIVVFEYDRKRTILSQWKTFLWGAVIAAVTSALVMLVFQYLFLVNLP